MQTKQNLRERLQKRRGNISAMARAASDQIILDQLIQRVDWQKTQWVHCYVPILRRDEVNTWRLFRYLWRYWPDIKTVVPGPMRSDLPTAYVVGPETTWHETHIAPLPNDGVPLERQVFDLIVVPCLGFDEARYRLGYGSGYYDRLLGAQTRAHTVGLAYSDCYVSNGLPYEPHDVTLQQIIDEKRVLSET
jgi:5-formyltetrahydrofolate cyclo-ligase